MKYRIMFIDDSISVLESLKWIFLDEPYYLFASNSPFESLSMISSLETAVVVVDQSIQEMDGLEFLERVRLTSPYTMGIIMTGYDGIKETFDSISSGCVYQFVKKPLDNNEIKQAVNAAITEYEINLASIRQAVYHKQCSQF
jgi:DNA-binding NtrC family response regulator